MNDEQDREQEGIAGWIIGFAAFLAVAVALWAGVWGAFVLDSNSSAGQQPSLTANTSASSTTNSQSQVAAPAAAAPMGVVGNTETVSVFFAVNQFSPPADSANQLDGLVTYARSNPNTKIGLSGFHDKTGDPVKNIELAKDRALAVKNVLISAGVPEDRIMMKKPTEMTGDLKDDKQARRVDVYVAQ
jgi:outer membrane protein OmpA-like peptidoglycan-associated protein